MIQYEFVGSEDRADEMLAEWGDAARTTSGSRSGSTTASCSSTAPSFTLAGLATRDFARERGIAALASAGRWAPGCAPARRSSTLENANLLLVLGGHGGASAAWATACASVKFLLLAAVIVYLVWGPVARATARSS